MTAPEILAWSSVTTGIVVAFALGWFGPAGFWATLGLLLADAVLGVGLTYAVSFVFTYCHETLKYCAQTTDRNVWSLTFPLVFIPAYWVATLLGKSFRPSQTPSHSPEGNPPPS